MKSNSHFTVNKIASRLSGVQLDLILLIIMPLRFLVELIDIVYPKDDKTIIFGSHSGEFMSGSPKALYDFALSNKHDFRCYYYLPFGQPRNYAQIFVYVLKYFHKFFRARYLVTSHPPSDFYPYFWSKRKVVINTWHGTSFKNMFFADNGWKSYLDRLSIDYLNKRISYFLVSSKIEAAMLAKCFLINPMKFRYTGQPRNDVLFSGRKEEPLPLNIPTVPPYSKVILYCPTYRRKKRADFFPFPDLDLGDFDRFLEEHKLLILLRGHVYNGELEKSYFSSRIIDFSLARCNDINPILPSIDMVITDYSSIFIDFLNLNRPCLFIPYDLESYQKDPGLLFDDYPYWAPGNHVLTYAEFITALKEILNGNDIYESRRKEINRQFNYYQTGDSCQKVFELIEKRQRNH